MRESPPAHGHLDATVPGVGLVGLVLVGGAAVLWGSSAAAARAFAEETGAPGVVTAFAEAVIAAPLLVAAGALARSPWPRPRLVAPAAIGTGALVAGFLVSYFTPIGMIGVTLASLVAISSAPLFTASLAVAFLRERPTRGTLAALGLGVVGAGLVLTGQEGSGLGDGSGRTGGVLLALLAGLCFGAENVVVRRLTARFHPTQLAALTTCVTVVLLAPLALPRGGVVSTSVEGWPWLLYLAVFPTALAPALHNAGLRRVTAIAAAIVGVLEPLAAAALGLLVFHEALGPAGAIGAGLLLLALVLLYATRRGRVEAREPA